MRPSKTKLPQANQRKEKGQKSEDETGLVTDQAGTGHATGLATDQAEIGRATDPVTDQAGTDHATEMEAAGGGTGRESVARTVIEIGTAAETGRGRRERGDVIGHAKEAVEEGTGSAVVIGIRSGTERALFALIFSAVDASGTTAGDCQRCLRATSITSVALCFFR
jgi:hypothetical protein